VIKFKTGETYKTRMICDSDQIISFEIVKRTPKTVTIKDIFNRDLIRKKIATIDGIETIFPLGKYSMAPVLKADSQ